MRNDFFEKAASEILNARNLSKEIITNEVKSIFGETLLIAGAGSLFAGYGNSESDIDVLVIVNTENKLSQLPIMSYKNEERIDSEFYTLQDIESTISSLKNQSWPPPNSITRVEWELYFRCIQNLSRFASSKVIYISEDSQFKHRALDLLKEFYSDWFRKILCDWWNLEAVRFKLIADYIKSEDILLGCLKLSDSIQYLLSKEVASQGEVFMGRKWLPMKIEKTGNKNLMEIYKQSLDVPVTRKEAEEYYISLEIIYDQLCEINNLDNICIRFEFSQGVENWSISEETLLSKWRLRHLTLKDVPSGLLNNGYSCKLSEEHPSIKKLLVNDMVWAGLYIDKVNS
ncbi:hypothetical protein Lepto782_24075 (plasmid) [Leptospira interrogans serovar Canicola]|uniref:Nucleotidyltransferase domain-containing protein n=2 Tax=Leptospira interrogans TaxID=173 RepID=A0AAP9WGX1_LEPIR|nr:hypothetical protein [Leptospira interrogans]QOI45251.1 hypothetical protein Lepto782_24075 [Leptospira interrogans serovar Canicola]QOI53116.1 hypothetical protein Lepto1489_22375 [Leptospira interrogans serovar Bataviae]